MSRDRRKIDPILRDIKTQIDALEERFTLHEQGEFNRYDKMIETAARAQELAVGNAAKLDALIKQTKGPIQLYQDGKTGLVIIQTSGKVVTWLAGVVVAIGTIWYTITHFKFPGG